MGLNVLWAKSRVQGDWRIFPSPSVPCLNCGGRDRWCHHLSSLQEISLSQFVLSPVWCSRPMTGVLLAPCHDEFRGSRSDYVRQVRNKHNFIISYIATDVYITWLRWPTQSPDLKLFENLWDELKWGIWLLDPVPSKLKTLENAVVSFPMVSNSLHHHPTTHRVYVKRNSCSINPCC
ncbi:uncharacterized protein TNCV_4880891 [Trichonephila clavipes]|nr:uncharacterized protein TNCV_4880891 [Trichonephila clavipes]